VSYEEMERFLNVSANANIQSLKAESDAVGKAFVTLAQKIFEKQDDTMKITLLNFFKELKSVGAEFGFRSAKEIYRFMGYALTCDDSTSKMNKDDIVDAAIVQKLLPKLHGSLKSLKPVLETLWTYCFEGDAPELSTIGTVLPTGEETASYRVLYKNSADKIFRMYRSAIVNGFTTFSEA
jgi:5-methylcytosine-specific restriction protein B